METGRTGDQIADLMWGEDLQDVPAGVDRRTIMMRSAVLGAAAVLLGCLALILYGPANVLPPYVVGIVAGLASGAAMLPYTVIKEANPPAVGGSATGVINLPNFTFSALLGPLFGWVLVTVSGGTSSMTLDHYQTAFEPLLYGVGLAILLTLILKETGPAAAGRRVPE